MIYDYESMMDCVLILTISSHLNIYGMQQIIDQQLEFLKSQSLITSAFVEGFGWQAKFNLLNGEWIVAVMC